MSVISSDPVLTLPDFDLPFELYTDASHYAAGAILYQRDENEQPGRELKVIGYYSYTFTKTQENYTTTEKEALAVVMSLRYFRSYLEGKHFNLFTDNQALTYLLQLTQPKGRIARWVSEIQQFSFDIMHRPGQKHQDADALSRLHVPQEIPKQSINLMKLWEGTQEMELRNGKMCVPETKVPQVLKLYHSSPHSGGHDGFSKTYHKLTQRFTWNNMKADVASYIKTCHECQMVKSKYKPRGNRMVMPEYSAIPFEVVRLDFAELKKKSEGVKRTQAFLVAVDECTRFVAAKAGREDANCVIALLEREIFTNTKIIVADNGPAFRSEKLRNWAKERNITLRYPAPYHPEANSLAERLIRDLKMYLKLYPEFKGGWKSALEAAVYHHNRSYTAGIGCSPHFAAFGTVPWLPADEELGLVGRIALKEHPKSQLQQKKYRSTMKKNFDRRHSTKMPDIDPGSMILVRKGLDSKVPFTGSYLVVKTAKQQGLLKTLYYTGPNGRTEEASVRNVVPYYQRKGNDSRPGECSDPHR